MADLHLPPPEPRAAACNLCCCVLQGLTQNSTILGVSLCTEVVLVKVKVAQ